MLGRWRSWRIHLDRNGFQPPSLREPLLGVRRDIYYFPIDDPAVSFHFLDSGVDDSFKIAGKPLARCRRIRYSGHRIWHKGAQIIRPGWAGTVGIKLRVDLLAAID